MTLLVQHRLAAAAVGVAVAATGAFFLFARPQYHPPKSSVQAVPVPSYVARADHGWTWAHGLPGFRFGHDEKLWNVARIRSADLSGLRLGARAAHVDPQSLRMLDEARVSGRSKPYLLVAGRDAHGSTCIGAQPGPAPVRFFCPAQLARHLAVVIAAPQPYYKGLGWAIHVSGVVGAAVTAVTITTAGTTSKDMRSGKPVIHPEGPQVVLQPGDRSWGTFASFRGQPVPWSARIDFYGAHGRLASLPLRFHGPGAYVYAVR